MNLRPLDRLAYRHPQKPNCYPIATVVELVCMNDRGVVDGYRLSDGMTIAIDKAYPPF